VWEERVISFTAGDVAFNFRAAGICVSDGYVLLHRAAQDDFWAPAGGRVEMGETSAGALRRELREELGVAVMIERLLWVAESIFTALDGKRRHVLGMYYLFTFPSGSPLLDKATTVERDEGALRLIFRWLPLDGLETMEGRGELPIYPRFLRTRLRHLPPHVEHIVDDDR
jgi:ADP-ribose pyrophosphatase YjhB (NUDIX family)